jgi:dTDP-4-dehydrorhamnose reductase
MGSSSAHAFNRAASDRPLELWGGIEATVNRVGDVYFDQLVRSGHASRIEDLDRIAELGVRTVRYPVLWEKVAPEGLERADWSWTDERLTRLRELGISPIAGLVHHGSGPRTTNLLDPGFAEGLAEYARAVAQRYPWVTAYTPVNEPLTTARFAALYGHWYPHATDGLSWARALLNECHATVLAMRAIREVTPGARLVQTEDMGKTHSTPLLAYQAEFENERRWLTFELLCGRVRPGHRMWQFLTWLGVPEEELAWFAENPCPPDVLGINHYLTSERFLDEHTERYPEHAHGGNGRHAYADVEAVRARAQGIEGPGALMLETWERYKLPVAITEAHLSSTREEQLRWLMEIWRGAEAARAEGADVRAVTVWSLLGAYNWNSLVTRDEGYYEPGAFDLRAPEPRATAITWVMQDLAAGREPKHPVLAEPGWWRRPNTRLVHEPVKSVQPRAKLALRQRRFSMRYARWGSANAPLGILGGDGPLGRTLAKLCDLRAIPYALLENADQVDEVRPWAVVDASVLAGPVGGRSRWGGPWSQQRLAGLCASRGIQLVLFSSDLVFDGRKLEPYVESDPVAPLTPQGRRLVDAERVTLDELPEALVVRTGPLFGFTGAGDPLARAIRRLDAGKPVAAPASQVTSPTYAPDFINSALDLLIDRETGIWHVANPGALTWHDLVARAADMAGVRTESLEPDDVREDGASTAHTALGSERCALLPPVDDALQRYLRMPWWAVATIHRDDAPMPLIGIDGEPGQLSQAGGAESGLRAA